ncbi:uncharacterized protein LOC116348215 [Contarinia nasturtii]|uniref:uncharacterized protein LOC116348215 n=1 Tax=Contarinia nasturtii TaxID=265458 RepID=UPI0012D3A1B7|nr:uncharacterized protein LOC116348215 [Contarinia nasturtii]
MQHEVMLCVAHQACFECCNTESIREKCDNCGTREHVFKGNDVVKEFMEYLGKIDEEFKQITIIAHNAQRYDSHFILKFMYKNTATWNLYEKSLIINGHYPHFFNTPENKHYIGALPDIQYYGFNNKSSKERNACVKWYNAEKQSGKIFNNWKQLLAYCKEDVNILRLACLKYRDIMLKTTDIEPFKQVTLAGTCITVFRTLFLKPNLISVIPRNGYRFADNQSFKALKWLEWESHLRQIKIHTAANGREIRLSGCYWHQCVECYPNQYFNNPNDRSAKTRSLYETYLARANKIRSMGYDLIEMWEHQFDKMQNENPAIELYIKSVDHLRVPPLDPRDAFMGGRTGVCKLYHKIGPNERILYYDVTSLYPYINKYGKYPVGTPKVLVGRDLLNRTVFDIEGLIKLDILPPRRLYHPVLGK